ncbi:MAG: tRNA pseudouridine(38-40) synthase TruA [Sphingobacteriales bacterium 17-39-43]|uniref:tRNA pseudouridine(38-40) synthase TruA n=1 Tax=Daejeonella sp. TaxID=2805397 RepID=UPI000BC39C05|nr:tRNA pseudouridine(38-40) synthase TruA [Daejeonella sp.]OYZ31392.1 MAG: tRNA pseudouridine(38-40) synthase TruA [Sphingobacteriales bacterium 16-39-50]OZA24270.1 MAG: tRNA pseudouridine(38-40) synthase TruA [Sphingobacteriales bacterium 17-39-43]HQT23054.1 tRNA pseudouridine(38-40) synthase TruA [Daejeonella sp.]HQT57940.1 tRNA pseudouridine(38-40) synthase TruA [Daejeonella sp.]
MDTTQRYFLELAYNGTAYHGWQIQQNALSVQELINKALSTICRQEIETLGCGRTDTGVHARQLFAHADFPVNIDVMNPRFLLSINAMLPYDIVIKRFIKVAPEAHARFDASLRSYEYHIHFSKDPFLHNLSWLLRDKPDIGLMNNAAALMMEYRDFSCFSKSNTQTFTNNCVISRAEWLPTDNGIVFHVSADRFLRNMVRAIVGTLVRIGKGEMNVDDIHSIIESKDRSNAGESVPACGLFLTEVKYPYITDEI